MSVLPQRAEVLAATDMYRKAFDDGVFDALLNVCKERGTVTFADVEGFADSMELVGARREGFIRVMESRIVITLYGYNPHSTK